MVNRGWPYHCVGLITDSAETNTILLLRCALCNCLIMCQALGVLSSLVERLDSAAAACLAAVEGLAAALLDQVLAAGETLMRCGAVKTSGGGTSGSGGAASTHGPRTGGGGGNGGGGSMGMSSGELPDVGMLQVRTLTPRVAKPAVLTHHRPVEHAAWACK